MSKVCLQRIERPNMRRFYTMQVQPNLFGGFAVVREWGRIGQSGTVAETIFLTEAEALDAVERQRRVKERRGYIIYEAAFQRLDDTPQKA